MPQVIAAVYPEGILKAETSYTEQVEITDDLPPGAIGQCVVKAVQRAWQAGYDPALAPFVVIVTFR